MIPARTTGAFRPLRRADLAWRDSLDKLRISPLLLASAFDTVASTIFQTMLVPYAWRTFIAGMFFWLGMPGDAADAWSSAANAPGPPVVGITNPPFAETAGPPPLTREERTNLVAQAGLETQRSLLALQDQLRASMTLLEAVRQQAETAAHLRAVSASNHLPALAQTQAEGRRPDLVEIQRSNRRLLIVLGGSAAVLILLVLLTVWFQVRALNRLAAVAFRPPEPLPWTPPVAPAPANPPLLAEPSAASQRLLGAVEKLEQRLRDLEHSLAAPPAPPALAPASPMSNGTHDTPQAQAASPVALPAAASEPPPANDDPVALLLGQGQSLLNAGHVEAALTCFDEIIAREPKHAEALMKKGVALERQEKYKEALEYYDRALEANRSLTLAYLHKGGVFNQLERFDEALHCYEQALKLQQLTGNDKTD